FLRNLYTGSPFQRHGFTSAPALVATYEHPYGDYTVSQEPVQAWVPWVVENYRRQLALAEALDDDTVPVARLSTGTHIYAAAFGCRVHSPGDYPCFALPLVHTATEADRLEEPDLWKSPSLYRVFELAHLVEQELGKDVWLGPCDMQTGFDTACLIWNKEDLFCAMIDPEAKESVKRLVAKCAHLLKTFLLELKQEFPQMVLSGCPDVWAPPDLGPWPSNDECGAVNTALFEEFMLPELVDLAETFGSLGMHCCATADHQFASFRRIPNFYAFNRVAPPGRGPEGFDGALQQLGGPQGPVFVIGWATEEIVAHLLQAAPAGTRFIFQQQPVQDLAEGQRLLERMRALADRVTA
ncbi:MAG: hypothetical protein ACPL3S_03810, partial [Halothiobacillaceae bacterium]